MAGQQGFGGGSGLLPVPTLEAVPQKPYQLLKAAARALKAIAYTLKAIACVLKAIAFNIKAIAFVSKAIAYALKAIAYISKAIAFNIKAIAYISKAIAFNIKATAYASKAAAFRGAEAMEEGLGVWGEQSKPRGGGANSPVIYSLGVHYYLYCNSFGIIFKNFLSNVQIGD